jgi:transcriptional regulator with XRE-family HTH domain
MSLAQQDYTPFFLHQNIRLLRKQLKLSQEELANRVGLNRGNIASYENGTAEPKICNLLKLSNLFGVSIIDLTQKNLDDHSHLKEASNKFQKLNANEKELMDQFAKRAEELQSVIQSIHTCFQFKAKSMQGFEQSREMMIIAMKFEELFDASENLLHNHHALIDFINCRCK